MRLTRSSRNGIIGTFSIAFMLASAGVGTPAYAEDLVQSPTAVISESQESGASSDAGAISNAADDYTANDATSVAELAEAASATDAVPMVESEQGLKAASPTGANVEVSEAGDITLSVPGLPKVGMSVAGDADSTEVIDGALVQSGVAPSTDIVTRATDNGVQLVVVLGDESAPQSIQFPISLPTNVDLIQQDDGSVAVVAPVKVESVAPAQSDQFTQDVADVVGDAGSAEELSDAQWKQLAALPTPLVTTTVVDQQVATIQAPWAVDANGDPVATRYTVQDGTLTQVFDTNSTTAFPVTADPSWWWWTWTATSCIADIGTFIFAAAKLAKMLLKVSSLVRKSATVAKWVAKLGGAEKTLKAIYYAAKGFFENGRIGKYLTNSTVLALSGFASAGLTLLGDALGIGSCVSLIRELL